jgi:hypothetical protein
VVGAGSSRCMRILLLSTIALVLVLIAGQTTLACECLTLTPSESLKRADLVFEGELVRIAQDPIKPTYTFSVNKLLKGSRVTEVIIHSMGSDCDARFDPDVIYRVYARTYEGKLISGLCSGNKILKTNHWPSLSYLRGDYKAVSVVAHIRIKEAEITGRIGGYENWKIVAEVLEPFKGRFKKGDVFEYFHGAEAGFKQEYFTGEKIVFLLAEPDADRKPRYTVLENTTLAHTPDRINKLRLIRSSSRSKRARR